MAKKMTDAGLLLSRGNSDEAEKIIATIEPHHTLVLFYSAFGYIHGRRADWKTARDFYVKSVEFAPADELSYYCLAPLLAQLDDIERLRHYREQMIKQFGTTSNSSTARHMAKGSLILPPAFEEFKTINKWVDMTVAAEPESANVYRITADGVRQALDAGYSAADLHGLFKRRSRTPVPQALTC